MRTQAGGKIKPFAHLCKGRTNESLGRSNFGDTNRQAVVAITTVLAKYIYPYCNADGCRWIRTRMRASASRLALTRKQIVVVHSSCSNAWKDDVREPEHVERSTGIYGAAYRLIDVSLAPVSALLYAAFPNFFRVGVPGISSTLTYVRPLLKRALGYSLLVCRGNVAIRERGAAHPGSRV